MRALIACGMLLLALPAAAETTITAGPNGGMTLVLVDSDTVNPETGKSEKELRRAGELFTQVSVDFDLGGGPHQGSLVLLYDGDTQGGFELRYFNKAAPGLSPGFGAGIGMLDADAYEFLDEFTVMAGAALYLKTGIAVNGQTLPLLFGIGVSFDIAGTDIAAFPLTLTLPLDLLTGGG